MKTNRLEQLLKGSDSKFGYWTKQVASFDSETSILRIISSNVKVFFEKKIPATQVAALKHKFPNIFKDKSYE